MKYVVVDGNIGAGKSTLLGLLADRGVRVIREPIGRWCSGFEHRGVAVDAPLDLFYRDPFKNALAFQLHVITTRVEQLRGLGRGGVVAIERDPFDTDIFVEDHFSTGMFDLFQHRSLVDLIEALGGCFPLERAGTVYLRLDPETCARRVRERARGAEMGLDAGRLRALHGLYESKYPERAGGVYRVDAELPPEAVVDGVMGFIASATAPL